MKMNKQFLTAAVVLASALTGYIGWACLRAHRDLVTLDVRNMDVREVVKKIEHQTWEDIYVDKAVSGRVTLRVRGVPLEEVLRMVGDQTSSRSQVLYPLYSGRASFKNLERSLRGEVDPATHGWTNLAPNPGREGGPGGPMLAGFGRGGFGGGPGPFGAMPDTGNQLVSLAIYGKDMPFAVAAFGRFAQARVVPEDGVTSPVSVTVKKVPVAKAVAELAAKAKRKWTKVYVLRGGFGGPGRMQLALRDGERPGRDRSGMADLTEEQRAQMRQQRDERQQELNQALPAAERQKLEQAEAERQQQMQALANLSPEQRREQMAQMFGANRQMDRNVRQRVLNSTPEQRAEMNRRRQEMRQRRDGGGQSQRPPGGSR